MDVISATDVRKNWSETLDLVVHQKPAFVKRTRDYVMMMNLALFKDILSDRHFTANLFTEPDGSITLSACHLDLVVNAKDMTEAKQSLASEILDYAEDYYQHFAIWSNSSNRKSHLVYVLKALSMSTEEIAEDIVCRDGKN